MERLSPTPRPRMAPEPAETELEEELRQVIAQHLSRTESEAERRILKAQIAFWLIAA
jgi:hypothetical protein